MVIKLNKQKGGGPNSNIAIVAAIVVMAGIIGGFSAYATVNNHKDISDNQCEPLVYYTFISGFLGLSLMIFTFISLDDKTCNREIYIPISLLLITSFIFNIVFLSDDHISEEDKCRSWKLSCGISSVVLFVAILPIIID